MQKLMLERIEKIDTVAWLRSLSPSQTTAIGELKHALRDDLLQGTSYRVYENLDQIGIRPRMPVKKLKRFITLSRASDLAFLYFILEGFYKISKKDEGYTNSEKLLMTAILILDIIFTVRALDRILPPRSVKETHTPPVEECIKENKSTKISKREESKKRSPYFQKFHRPKTAKPKNVVHQQELEADFTFWNAGHKPNYEVENEDRWFAEYELQPSKRVVHKVLNRAIKCLLAHIDLPLELSDGPSMCEHHEQWEKDKKEMQDAFIVAANKTCHKLIEERNSEKKRRAEILKQLEDDINWYTAKYKRISQMQRTPVQVIGRTCADACDKCNKALVNTQEKLSENMRILNLEQDIKRLETATTGTAKTISGPNRILKEVFLPNSNSDNTVNTWPKRGCFSKKNRALSVVDGCKLRNLDIEREMKYSRNSKFFSSPTAESPFKFDYTKIFPNNNNNSTFGEDFTIRRAFVKVLRTKEKSVVYGSKTINASCINDRSHSIDCTIQRIDIDEESSDSSSDEFDADKINVYKAVIDCAEDICRQKIYHIGPENICRQLKATTERRNSRYIKKELVPLVYDDIDYFDPGNKNLMDRLLEDGISALRCDRRFVLACFPNADKLTVLREWIKRRFGKKYNYEELQKSIRESGEIFQACTKIHGHAASVSLMGLPSRYVSYGSHDEMFKLGMEVKKHYVGSLNEKLFEHMRYCWMAMGGHMVNQANAAKLFFTYMPAKDSEIHRVRPWNGEFRDFKRFREDRKRREAALNK